MKKNAKLKKKITKYRPETQDDIFTMPYNYFYTNIFILKIEKKIKRYLIKREYSEMSTPESMLTAQFAQSQDDNKVFLFPAVR